MKTKNSIGKTQKNVSHIYKTQAKTKQNKNKDKTNP